MYICMYPADIPGNVAQVKRTKRDRAQRYNQVQMTRRAAESGCTAAGARDARLCALSRPLPPRA